MMAVYLERLGFQVTTADTTERAWAAVQNAPEEYAVAVLDGSMPGITSEELALRILGANRSARIIAASGYPVDMSPLEAAAPGRAVFLQKPFSPEMLAATVRRMLAPEKESL